MLISTMAGTCKDFVRERNEINLPDDMGAKTAAGDFGFM
jgi:hypothetical protein